MDVATRRQLADATDSPFAAECFALSAPPCRTSVVLAHLATALTVGCAQVSAQVCPPRKIATHPSTDDRRCVHGDPKLYLLFDLGYVHLALIFFLPSLHEKLIKLPSLVRVWRMNIGKSQQPRSVIESALYRRVEGYDGSGGRAAAEPPIQAKVRPDLGDLLRTCAFLRASLLLVRARIEPLGLFASASTKVGCRLAKVLPPKVIPAGDGVGEKPRITRSSLRSTRESTDDGGIDEHL